MFYTAFSFILHGAEILNQLREVKTRRNCDCLIVTLFPPLAQRSSNLLLLRKSNPFLPSLSVLLTNTLVNRLQGTQSLA